MKTKVLFFLAIICSFAANAQNNPYETFGYKSNIVYKTNVSQLYQIKNRDTTSIAKAIAFNFDEGYVLFLGNNDSVINKIQIESDKLLRFISTDPKAIDYPSLNPYCFVGNMPLIAVDPNGKDVVFLIDKEGAGSYGHMGMLFQDKSGAWSYFSQGAAPEEGSQFGFVSGSNYTGGVTIRPMQTVSQSGEIINMTKEQAIAFVQSGGGNGTKYDNSITLTTTNKQDELITQNAYSLQKDFQTKKETYNMYTNNCVDAAQDVVEGTKGTSTGISLPSDWDPRPNEYFKKLQSSIPVMNGEVKLVTIPSTMDNIPAKTLIVPVIP